MQLRSPVGTLVVTSERWGHPGFGSRTVGGAMMPNGIGFACLPGTPVVSPCAATVSEVVTPNGSGSRFTGLVLRPEAPGDITLRIFFLTPRRGLIGRKVVKGECIGSAQDIRARYPDAIPHIYIDAWLAGEGADPMRFFTGGG